MKPEHAILVKILIDLACAWILSGITENTLETIGLTRVSGFVVFFSLIISGEVLATMF